VPPTATTSASRCSARRACCKPATTARPKSSLSGPDVVSIDKPEHFFLQRYRDAYRLELVHFFGRLQDGGPFRTTIDDGVAAQKLADAAAQSLESGAVVRL
jgi:predicted dehydrogenase